MNPAKISNPGGLGYKVYLPVDICLNEQKIYSPWGKINVYTRRILIGRLSSSHFSLGSRLLLGSLPRTVGTVLNCEVWWHKIPRISDMAVCSCFLCSWSDTPFRCDLNTHKRYNLWPRFVKDKSVVYFFPLSISYIEVFTYPFST